MDDKFREKVKRAIEDGTYKQELEKIPVNRDSERNTVPC